MIDFQDSRALMELGNKNIELAKLYENIKKDHSEAQIYFDLKLAAAYHGSLLETKIAYEKAILLLVENEEDIAIYRKLRTSEHRAKSLEKTMNANSEKLMLCMSLIKNKQKIMGEQ